MNNKNVNLLHTGCLQIRQRGAWPEGRGEVLFSCPIMRRISPLCLENCGKIKRVRGLAYPLRLLEQFGPVHF